MTSLERWTRIQVTGGVVLSGIPSISEPPYPLSLPLLIVGAGAMLVWDAVKRCSTRQ